MLYNPSGSATSVSLSQLVKQFFPILFTLPDSSTSVRFPQPWNAQLPTLVAPPPTTTFVMALFRSSHGAPLSDE